MKLPKITSLFKWVARRPTAPAQKNRVHKLCLALNGENAAASLAELEEMDASDGCLLAEDEKGNMPLYYAVRNFERITHITDPGNVERRAFLRGLVKKIEENSSKRQIRKLIESMRQSCANDPDKDKYNHARYFVSEALWLGPNLSRACYLLCKPFFPEYESLAEKLIADASEEDRYKNDNEIGIRLLEDTYRDIGFSKTDATSKPSPKL